MEQELLAHQDDLRSGGNNAKVHTKRKQNIPQVQHLAQWRNTRAQAKDRWEGITDGEKWNAYDASKSRE